MGSAARLHVIASGQEPRVAFASAPDVAGPDEADRRRLPRHSAAPRTLFALAISLALHGALLAWGMMRSVDDEARAEGGSEEMIVLDGVSLVLLDSVASEAFEGREPLPEAEPVTTADAVAMADAVAVPFADTETNPALTDAVAAEDQAVAASTVVADTVALEVAAVNATNAVPPKVAATSQPAAVAALTEAAPPTHFVTEATAVRTSDIVANVDAESTATVGTPPFVVAALDAAPLKVARVDVIVDTSNPATTVSDSPNASERADVAAVTEDAIASATAETAVPPTPEARTSSRVDDATVAPPTEASARQLMEAETAQLAADEPVAATTIELPTPPVPKPRPTAPNPPPVAKPVEAAKAVKPATRPRPATQPSAASVAERAAAGPNPGQAGAGGSSVDERGTASLSDYKSKLAARLRRFRSYPEAARARALTGTASVSFTVNASGAVTKASLAASSGHRVLDDAALEMVRRASPFPPIPASAGVNSLTISVPVRFDAN